MILHRRLGSMSESTVLAIAPLSDKGEAERDAGVLTITCPSWVHQERARGGWRGS
jgi:hypothetical protein